MSVVNQMLMDLERRGALPAGDALGADVRAARQPAPRDRVLPLVLLAVGPRVGSWMRRSRCLMPGGRA